MAKISANTKRALYVGGGVLAAAAIVGGVVLYEKKAAAAPSNGGGGVPPAPPGVNPISIPSTLKAGEQYKLVIAAPTAALGQLNAQLQTPTQQSMQAFADSLQQGEFTVVSVNPTTTGTTMSATVIFNVNSADYTVPAITAQMQQNFAQQGATVTIADMGPASVNASAPGPTMGGGVQKGNPAVVNHTQI